MTKRKSVIYVSVIAVLFVFLAAGVVLNIQKIQVPPPQEQYGMILEDNSILFWGDDKGIAVLSASCDPEYTFSACSNAISNYRAIIMQGCGKNVEDTVYALVSSHRVENLLVPDGVSNDFLVAIKEKYRDITISELSSSKHFILGDMLLHVLEQYDNSVALSLVHGEQEFMVSSEVYSKKHHFTYALMPNDVLSVSAITCDYAVYDEKVAEEQMLSCASTLTDFNAGAIYFYGNGTEFNVLGVR